MDSLFVYGTLGPGRPNEHVMQKIGGQWRTALVRGRLVQEGWGADMGFPALVLDEAGDDIRGHVFVSENLAHSWADLDEFEGAEYQRVLTTALLEDGSRVETYVYALRR